MSGTTDFVFNFKQKYNAVKVDIDEFTEKTQMQVISAAQIDLSRMQDQINEWFSKNANATKNSIFLEFLNDVNREIPNLVDRCTVLINRKTPVEFLVEQQVAENSLPALPPASYQARKGAVRDVQKGMGNKLLPRSRSCDSPAIVRTSKPELTADEGQCQIPSERTLNIPEDVADKTDKLTTSSNKSDGSTVPQPVHDERQEEKEKHEIKPGKVVKSGSEHSYDISGNGDEEKRLKSLYDTGIPPEHPRKRQGEKDHEIKPNQTIKSGSAWRFPLVSFIVSVASVAAAWALSFIFKGRSSEK